LKSGRENNTDPMNGQPAGKPMHAIGQAATRLANGKSRCNTGLQRLFA
jgi:hypothetical protein